MSKRTAKPETVSTLSFEPQIQTNIDDPSMSEPGSGSDRVKRAQDSIKVHQPCVSDFYSWRVLMDLVRTIVECDPRLTRSLPLLGSDVEAEPFDSYR